MNLAPIALAPGEKAASKSGVMWLWWMCGTQTCNLPAEAIADNTLMSFPKTWGISKRCANTNAEIYGRLSLSEFLFSSLKAFIIKRESEQGLFSLWQTKPNPELEVFYPLSTLMLLGNETVKEAIRAKENLLNKPCKGLRAKRRAVAICYI